MFAHKVLVAVVGSAIGFTVIAQGTSPAAATSHTHQVAISQTGAAADQLVGATGRMTPNDDPWH